MTLLKHGYICIPGSSLMYILSFLASIICNKYKKRHRKNIESRSIHFFILTAFVCVYLLYFISVIRKSAHVIFSRRLSSCFNAGILLYLTLTLPVLFTFDYFCTPTVQDLINDIDFTGYCIVFFFLIKTFLCKSKTAI